MSEYRINYISSILKLLDVFSSYLPVLYAAKMVRKPSIDPSLFAYFLLFYLEAAPFKLFSNVCNFLCPLSDILWRSGTPVNKECIRKIKLRLLNALTVRHDNIKLEKFCIASKRSNQDV